MVILSGDSLFILAETTNLHTSNLNWAARVELNRITLLTVNVGRLTSGCAKTSLNLGQNRLQNM